eukprot:1447490-Rhodomonas_salina.1
MSCRRGLNQRSKSLVRLQNLSQQNRQPPPAARPHPSSQSCSNHSSRVQTSLSLDRPQRTADDNLPVQRER